MFRELANSALEHSRQEKRSFRHDEFRMTPLVKQFGDRQAENILPEEFEAWLGAEGKGRTWTPRHGRPVYRLGQTGVSARRTQP
jgi:hypothetical protein